jgi:hypothetical protein
VVPSAKAMAAVLVSSAVLAGLGASGCETTQKAAARVRINSERTLEGRKPVKIKGHAENIDIVDASLIKGDGAGAVVVEVKNTGTEPVSDLPILVGVSAADGDKEPLNGGKDLPYFQTHLPAVSAGHTMTWVYVAKKVDPDAAKAYAEIGAGPTPPFTSVTTIPEIDIGTPTASADDPSKVTVDVKNDLGFTQYDLPVFAWATKGDRPVAAAFASAGDLESGETETVDLDLIGDAKGAELHVSAPPTIYQ